MESPPEDDFSLFEGMVLFSPSDLSPPPPQNLDDSSPPPSPPSPPPPSPPQSPPPTSSQSQPLDEDLFSDLTLESQSQSQTLESKPVPINSRQVSRKKKRAVRIGYARDSLPLEDASSSLPPSIKPEPVPIKPTPDPQSTVESSDESKDEILDAVLEEEGTETAADSKEVALGSIEGKLDLIRARISSKLEEIREKAAVVSARRKEMGRRRRKAMESVNLASEKYKELERELEEACEAEDFERAERLSESLAEKEKVKDGLLSELRDAELECDAVDSEMEGILELQIAAEEEGVALLEQFAKDAADHADSILKRAEEISSKELEEWEASMELLEVKKVETNIESQLISEARSGMENSIDHLVEDDRQQVEILRRKKGILSKELDELLALVRLKDAEIAENDYQINEVEKKISDVISEFHGTQSSVDLQHDNLQLSLSKLESESVALSIRKKEIDEFILQAQQERSKLRDLASVSLDEARTCQEMVGLRKSLASSMVKSREDKLGFAKTEERILEEIQILRQQISAARTALQELSSTRVSIQQEITSCTQRIGFIDKRSPELEAEKKVAATARNFKEAGRIAAEAKSLNAEKESLQTKKETAILDLEKLEKEIKDTVYKIQESECLILLKEKEAASAGCKRLRLVAASARAERLAALEMGDIEEGESLLNEAEAAESKAKELQETYDLEPEEQEKSSMHTVSIAFITNLEGRCLAEMASSLAISASGGSQT